MVNYVGITEQNESNTESLHRRPETRRAAGRGNPAVLLEKRDIVQHP